MIITTLSSTVSVYHGRKQQHNMYVIRFLPVKHCTGQAFSNIVKHDATYLKPCSHEEIYYSKESLHNILHLHGADYLSQKNVRKIFVILILAMKYLLQCHKDKDIWTF